MNDFIAPPKRQPITSNWTVCANSLHEEGDGSALWCSFLTPGKQEVPLSTTFTNCLLISTAKTCWFSEHNFYLFTKILCVCSNILSFLFVFSEDLPTISRASCRPPLLTNKTSQSYKVSSKSA